MSNFCAIKTVIGGSYRKHLNEMLLIKNYLIEKGIHVQAPTGTIATNPHEEFVLLNSDPVSDP